MKPRRLLIPLGIDKLGSPKWRDPSWLGPVAIVALLSALAFLAWVYWSPAP